MNCQLWVTNEWPVGLDRGCSPRKAPQFWFADRDGAYQTAPSGRFQAVEDGLGGS
jgi:hypothetical protein